MFQKIRYDPFPQFAVPSWGFPINEDYSVLGYISGSSYKGNSHILPEYVEMLGRVPTWDRISVGFGVGV